MLTLLVLLFNALIWTVIVVMTVATHLPTTGAFIAFVDVVCVLQWYALIRYMRRRRTDRP